MLKLRLVQNFDTIHIKTVRSHLNISGKITREKLHKHIVKTL